MSLHRFNNSGYLMGDGSRIDAFAGTSVGRQGIHNLNDLRYHESTGDWTIASGYTPRFHNTTTSNNYGGSTINKDFFQGGSHTFQFHPSTTGTKNGHYFSDWGNDIWDGWGYFHLYYQTGDPRSGMATYDNQLVDFGNQLNTADGQKNTNTFSTPTNLGYNLNWTVTHGFPVGGVWMMHLECDDQYQYWQLVTGGNMGSDGNTFTRDNTHDVTISTGQTLRLHYRENSDSSSFNSSEQVRWYFIPRPVNLFGQSTSTNRWYQAVVSGDNHYLWSNSTFQALTLYIVKGNAIAPSSRWVGDDLQQGA